MYYSEAILVIDLHSQGQRETERKSERERRSERERDSEKER